jgi:hypothetical protein
MAHYLAGVDRFRDLIHDDDYRSDAPSYRFGRTEEKRVRSCRASHSLGGYLRNIIEAIANSKLRRMKHELELHGYTFDRPGENWEAPPPMEPWPESK